MQQPDRWFGQASLAHFGALLARSIPAFEGLDAVEGASTVAPFFLMVLSELTMPSTAACLPAPSVPVRSAPVRSATVSSVALALGLVMMAATPRPAQALTMMLNFTSASATDLFANTVVNESFSAWGFTGLSLNDVRNATLAAVSNDFLNFPAFGAGTSSPPLPAGKQLNINFEWTTGLSAPTNGDTQYFYLNIGDAAPNVGYLGQACYGCVRSNGLKSPAANGSQVGSILTDSIAGLLGLAPTTASASTCWRAPSHTKLATRCCSITPAARWPTRALPAFR